MGLGVLAGLLAVIGIAGEVYRLLKSEERLTARVVVQRCLIGVLSSLAVLAAKVRHPDLDDAAIVGIAAAVAVLGYSFLEEPIKAAVRGVFKRFFGEVKRDDSE